jgi:hypothetical protein
LPFSQLPFPVSLLGIWHEPANLDELEAKRLDLREDAKQRGAVGQNAREDAIPPTPLRYHFREGSKRRCAKMALHADRVELRNVIPHASILNQRLVKPHRRNLVSEKAKLSRTLDGFGAAAGAELRIDIANVGVHGVH